MLGPRWGLRTTRSSLSLTEYHPHFTNLETEAHILMTSLRSTLQEHPQAPHTGLAGPLPRVSCAPASCPRSALPTRDRAPSRRREGGAVGVQAVDGGEALSEAQLSEPMVRVRQRQRDCLSPLASALSGGQAARPRPQSQHQGCRPGPPTYRSTRRG